ncbi:hypothetical protein R3W88_033744 [Solanum pinnatisectum]|uniref:YTH domain-containing family protein n=1 Tax=Solanum pinnatisectum TaxID=50273 RepID=A0AAV9K0C1_9SOLN|nr:hypothetical protein R3W88_033744 [Solanum pinnatisectum]
MNEMECVVVKMDQGQQLLKIFKDHVSKQCILDDFEFYEDRQKRIQEKKAKQQLFQKQLLSSSNDDFFPLWEGKVSDEKKKENSKSELKFQKPSEVSVVLKKESLPLHTNGQVQFTKNMSVTNLVDDVKGAKPIILSDKKHVVANGIANGVANAC